jgi:hypothetical protein
MLKELIFSGLNLLNNIVVQSGGYYRYGYLGLWPSALAFVVYCSLFYLLIFRPGIIIDRLKLDKDFYEEQFTFSMDRLLVMRMSFIIVGMYLLVDAVPVLCKDLIAYYQAYTSNIYSETKNYNAQGVGLSGVRVLAGYLLLANSDFLAAFVTKNNNSDSES